VLQEVVNSIGGIANIITAILIIAGFVMTVTKKGKEIVGKWFKKVNEPTNNAILCVLRSNVRDMCECCIDKGFMTREEFEDLSDAAEAYEGLGGNSSTHRLVTRSLELPIKNEPEKE